MNHHASQFLKSEGIIKEGNTSFFIQFEDGSQIELTEVLAEYHKAASKDLLEALQRLVHLHNCEMEGISSGQPTPEEWMDAINYGNEALLKALK